MKRRIRRAMLLRGALLAAAATVSVTDEGRLFASERSTRLVNELARISFLNPQRVDEAVSHVRFNSPSVRQCLQALAKGSAGPAMNQRRFQTELNNRFKANGLSPEYSSSPAGNTLLWSMSMLMAMEGRPWLQTPAGSAELQLLQACPMMEMIQPGMCRMIYNMRKEVYAETVRLHGSTTFIRCP